MGGAITIADTERGGLGSSKADKQRNSSRKESTAVS